MEWLFALFALCAIGALIDDIHTKWHKRQMLEIQQKGSNVYV